MVVILIATGVSFYISSRPEPELPPKPRPYVWSVDMEELKAMAISLPPEGISEAWVKHEDRYWYFDQPNGLKVNTKRWGGGIPLLLSGPGAERLIAGEVTADQLGIYGLKDPKMKIALTLENEDIITVEVGDSTPDGQAYYIKLIDSRDVYSVHHTWYDVLERLVLDPPYPEPEEK